MLRVLNIRTAVPMQKPLEALIAKKLRCSRSDISGICIVRRAIDARRKPRIYFVFTVDVSFVDEKKVWKRCRDNKDVRQIAETPAPEIIPGSETLGAVPSSSVRARRDWRLLWPWPNMGMHHWSLNEAVTSIPGRKTWKRFGAEGRLSRNRTSSLGKAVPELFLTAN